MLKKCKKPDDVLFINASEHFEKGKRQNNLRPEDIEKIVSTYRERKVKERYSRRVSIEEIAEKHNYNLNISRYVSTAEAEKEIKLDVVSKRLDQLEEEITITKKSHNAFLKELGLKLLP